ncbi:MAG: alpha/beta hydrolase [Chloroflexi bacterium]|nr:alpha/beta hydrolase [Chloroflexota bacterium]
MSLDPQARAVLEAAAALGQPPLEETTPEEARRNFILRRQSAAAAPRPVREVSDGTVPGPAGDIPIRVYRPAEGVLPALVYFHGGGWVIGNLDTHDGTCRDLAAASGCAVISVDYRLAPEHPFPAPLDDCFAATAWVGANANGLKIDPRRIAVGGDSAGGHLAAGVAQMARDQSGPSLAYQLLIYPVTDRDFTTASYVANAEGFGLTRTGMQWFWNHFVPQHRSHEPYASPLRAPDLRGLPRTHVITAEYDVLRDDGRQYAERLRAAGVRTQYDDHPGLVHGFFGMAGQIDRAATIVREAGQLLGEALRTA